MRTKLRHLFLAFIVITVAQISCSPNLADEKSAIRQAAVAGGFYPASPEELRKMVDDFVAEAPATQLPGDLVGIIAPHAGYIYSGKVAAHSYALLKGRKYDRVVVIAPSHFEAFEFSSVFSGDAYATPLGTVPVDKEFAAKLVKQGPFMQLSTRGHTPTQQQGEHALEVQLPFLQRTIGDFKLVPIIMGEQTYEIERALGVALAKMVTGTTNTLIVASSDLSHYHTYDEASKMDHKTLQSIERWDYLSLSENFERRIWEACGGGPIVSTMIAAERLGAKQARILKYANTGDSTGDHSRVVGYGAVAFFKATKTSAAEEHPFTLDQKEKDALVALARKSVETAVTQTKFYEPPAPESSALQQERGAFVTLKERGQLRGCIGLITPQKPLYLTVRDAAAYAALEDPRFPAVNASELPQLEYEVSVLTPFHRVYDVKDVRVGRDGLLMIQGRKQGVLLPQVPVEQGWDRKTFLDEACLKAGLSENAWQQEITDIFAFSAIVFQ
jgi:AmmeMemoRadiSam system protein B/AmmeMemoRadiSam system protein A